jgi:hypothetical protein
VALNRGPASAAEIHRCAPFRFIVCRKFIKVLVVESHPPVKDLCGGEMKEEGTDCVGVLIKQEVKVLSLQVARRAKNNKANARVRTAA